MAKCLRVPQWVAAECMQWGEEWGESRYAARVCLEKSIAEGRVTRERGRGRIPPARDAAWRACLPHSGPHSGAGGKLCVNTLSRGDSSSGTQNNGLILPAMQTLKNFPQAPLHMPQMPATPLQALFVFPEKNEKLRKRRTDIPAETMQKWKFREIQNEQTLTPEWASGACAGLNFVVPFRSVNPG